MEFVRIEPGAFDMGLRPGEPGDVRPAPPHRVRISRAFYLGRTEVTQGQWRAVMGGNPSHFEDCGDDCPVENVTREDAQAFVARLDAANPGRTFRLPTEAEWEYACRAGHEGRYGAVDTLRPAAANFDARIPFDGVTADVYRGAPTPAGTFPPNPWGLYDMQGNVWEWMQDRYCPYPAAAVTDPAGSCATDTIPIRGGSWYFSANAARCGRRFTHFSGDRGFSLGFRVLMETPAEE
jgi:formylglycine-generating enzyme required for sulfatase activity